MRVIIAGGRDFSNYKLLRQACDYMLSKAESIEIVSGTAGGADQLGEKYASERGYSIRRFPADWEKFGRAAGFKRNSEMSNYADCLIAFWDGESKGTRHMINTARKKNMQFEVIKYKK